MTVKSNIGAVIAADTKTALADTDQSLLSHTQLFMSVLEAAKRERAPVITTQRLFRSFHRSTGKILEGREEMTRSIGLLHKLALQRGEQALLEGCYDGFPTNANDQEIVAAGLAMDACG